jgi:hypothetical protein
MRASVLLTVLPLAVAACAVSPEVTPYPPDAMPGMGDAAEPPPPGDASGPIPDAGPMGDAGSPADAPPTLRTVGWSEPFTDSQIGVPPDTLFVFELPPIDNLVSLEAWGIIPDQTTNAQVRMALYSDLDGTPGELVTFSDEWPAQNGQQAANQDPLAAGVYWLAVLVDSGFAIGNDTTQLVNGCPGPYAFSEPFADPYQSAGSDCVSLEVMNIYIVVRDLE